MLDATGVLLGHFEPEAGYTTIFEIDEPLPLEAANGDAVRETAAALPYVREGELPEAWPSRPQSALIRGRLVRLG